MEPSSDAPTKSNSNSYSNCSDPTEVPEMPTVNLKEQEIIL